VLNSFYGGIENMFKQIDTADAGPPLAAAKWHRDLLDRMAAPAAHRGSHFGGAA
jgi:hypothetical protein